MRHRAKVILILALFIVFCPALGSATSVVVGWNANTESDLAGYIIYWGTKTGAYSAAVDVGNVTGYQFDNVGAGVTYYVVVTAYDTQGNESDYSNEVSIYVPKAVERPAVTISLVGPAKGAVVGSNPLLRWKGTGLARYRVYASVDGRNYHAMYNGTGTSCYIPSSTWSTYVKSGTTVYWYVQGTTSSNQVYKSSVSYFKRR